MIISKTNIIADNSITLESGTLSSGALSNLQDPDFSRLASSNSSTFEFTVDGIGSCEYIALHGLNLALGTVVTLTSPTVNKSFTVSRPIKNLVFYLGAATTVSDLTVSFAGSGQKVISYIQAGLVSHVAWGTNAGQSLYYLGRPRKRGAAVTASTPITKMVMMSSTNVKPLFFTLLYTRVYSNCRALARACIDILYRTFIARCIRSVCNNRIVTIPCVVNKCSVGAIS